jgi:hypothetical protein
MVKPKPLDQVRRAVLVLVSRGFDPNREWFFLAYAKGGVKRKMKF